MARALILYESADLAPTYILSIAAVRQALADLVPEDPVGDNLVQEAYRIWDDDLPVASDSKFDAIFREAKSSGHESGVFLMDSSGRLEHFPMPSTSAELIEKLQEYAR